MTDLSDELTAKSAAIRKARNNTKAAIPAEKVLAILKANLPLIQAAIDALPNVERCAYDLD